MQKYLRWSAPFRTLHSSYLDVDIYNLAKQRLHYRRWLWIHILWRLWVCGEEGGVVFHISVFLSIHTFGTETIRNHVTAMSVSYFTIVKHYFCCILYFKELTHGLIWGNVMYANKYWPLITQAIDYWGGGAFNTIIFFLVYYGKTHSPTFWSLYRN